MRFLLVLITIYAAIVLYGGVVNANEPDAPIAVQTTGWDIMGLHGAQQVGLKPDNCLMTTQYDNGVQIAFKATGNKLTAMRVESAGAGIDLNNFVGFVGLGIGKNSYALQSKSTDGRIDATLLTVPNLAEKLKDATVFRLKLGTDNTYFALQGFDDGFHRLMVCMGIMPTKKMQVVNHAKGMPRPPIVEPKVNGETIMPSEPIEAVQAMKLDQNTADEDVDVVANEVSEVQELDMPTPITPLPKAAKAKDGDDSASDVDKAQEVAKPELPEWRALKGQKLSSVLIGWADKQGVQTHIAMDRDPILTKDIVMNGSFEMAVNALLKQTGVENGASAIVKNNNGRVTHVAGYQGGALTQGEASGNHRWRALEGSDLRKVLMQWSAREGIDFVWDAPEIYLVRQSVKTTTTYEDAVTLILNQFNGQPTRPVAQLNKDPDTGRMSLIVKTTKS